MADVELFDGSGVAQIVGALPTTRSDLSAVTVGERDYVLGGFDGTTTVPTVLSTSNGTTFHEFARMPVPVRYAAVASQGHVIYAFGGELADGSDTDAIQSIDTVTGRARVIGHVPHAFSHSSAVALGGRILILGGRIAGARERPAAVVRQINRSGQAGGRPADGRDERRGCHEPRHRSIWWAVSGQTGPPCARS